MRREKKIAVHCSSVASGLLETVRPEHICHIKLIFSEAVRAVFDFPIEIIS